MYMYIIAPDKVPAFSLRFPDPFNTYEYHLATHIHQPTLDSQYHERITWSPFERLLRPCSVETLLEDSK